MTEINQVFDGDLAERVFLIASAIFVAFYAGGILLTQWTKAGSRRTAFQAKTAVTALFFALALTAVASGFWRPNGRRVPSIARRRFHPSNFKGRST